MKLTPLADRVILKMVEVEETTKGGIILTASAKEKPSVAEVISVGPGGMVDGRRVRLAKREQAPPLDSPPPVCGLATPPKAAGSKYFCHAHVAAKMI